MFKKLLFIPLLFIATNCCALTLFYDFEGGTHDLSVSDFSSTNQNISYDDFVSDSDHGDVQVKGDFFDGLEEGINAKGTTIFDTPITVTEGDHWYFHLDVYYPSTPIDWSFDQDFESSRGIKLFRLHMREADTSNAGYISFIINGGADDEGNVYLNFEGIDTGYGNFGIDETPHITRDEWHSVDGDFVLNQSESGYARMVYDGTTYKESDVWDTMPSDAADFDFCFLFSSWNGGSPQTQWCRIDNYYISNEQSYADYIGVPNSTKASNITATNITFS